MSATPLPDERQGFLKRHYPLVATYTGYREIRQLTHCAGRWSSPRSITCHYATAVTPLPLSATHARLRHDRGGAGAILVATRLPAHIFQKPAHRVELRTEAHPISGFQALHCLIVVVECLARPICRRACERPVVALGAAGAVPASKSADSASASVSFITTCSP
jgi:hypothetical protein